jgi:phage terminase large subunit-like protein
MMNELDRPSRAAARRRLVWIIGAMMAGALAGCGDENPIAHSTLYPVKGKVTLPDGQPLSSGKVIFRSTTTTVTNTFPLESDGTFSKEAKEGLPEGEYKAYLELGEMASPRKRASLPFAGKYLDEDRSDLIATVKPEGSNDFGFKLTAK